MNEPSVDPEAVSHCPNCGADYRAGFADCADCGIPLVPGPAAEPQQVRREKLDFYEEQDMRHFGRTFDMFDEQAGEVVAIGSARERELGLLIGKLESEGIGARPGQLDLSRQALALGMTGLTGTPTGGWEPYQVLVRGSNAGKAKEIFEAFRLDLTRPGKGIQGPSLESYPPPPGDVPDQEAWADANRRIWGSDREK